MSITELKVMSSHVLFRQTRAQRYFVYSDIKHRQTAKMYNLSLESLFLHES